ncbi:MAG: EI24 domain-containing protein, partial [Nocardioidaceae bacterium]|nr:EI24 domain-containing protein [Nocardioidaceae bacterium]
MGLGRGVAALARGLRLWRDRPRLMLLGIVPAVVVAILVGALLITWLFKADDVVSWATPFADDWNGSLRAAFRVVLTVLAVLGAAIAAVVTFTGLTLAVGDRFYEKIWKETERSLGGEVPTDGVGWLRGALDGVGLVLFGVAMAIVVFAIGLLPLIGGVVGAALGLLLAGRLLAGELVSRPLQARGFDRAARRTLLRPHRRALLGCGVCVQACCVVPLAVIAVMTAAGAG